MPDAYRLSYTFSGEIVSLFFASLDEATEAARVLQIPSIIVPV